MNIVVCVKPVPDPDNYNLLRIDPETKRLVRAGIPTIVNPSDLNAIEAALQLKAQFGGKVIILSMAPLDAEDKIKQCLAMGADEAVIVSDRAFGGADTLATSYTLVEAIKKIGGIDLVITGNESADGATSQVSPQIGEWLGWPHVANTLEIASEDGKVYSVKKKTANGHIEYKVEGPAVFAVARGCNKPRMVSAMGIIKAKNKPISVFTRADMDVDEKYIGLNGSGTKAGKLIEPDMRRHAEELKGSPDEVAAQIIAIVKKAGIVF